TSGCAPLACMSFECFPDRVNKQSHIVFRRARQYAMTKAANPTGPFAILHRFQIAIKVLLQVLARRVQQSLIEVTLNETVGRNIERVAEIPRVIDADTQEFGSDKPVLQMGRLRSF